MIVTEFINLNGRPGIKTFSDQGVYIIDDNNILYPIAYDLLVNPKNYFETDKIIEE